MPSQLVFFPKLARRRKYPYKGKYNKYRKEIREDSRYRCVYCDVHELELWHHPEIQDERMTLDHFRPKSLYSNLAHEPANLVLACPVCNNKKADDWPAYGQSHGGSVDGNAGYIDPFEVDRLEYFGVLPDGSLSPLKSPAEYMIRVLLLNRPALKRIRRRKIQLHEHLSTLEAHFNSEIERLEFAISQSGENLVSLEERLVELRMLQLVLEGIIGMIKLD